MESKMGKSVYDKNYFELGARDARSSHFNRMLKVYRPLARMLARLKVHRALDVGCATGSLVKALLEENVDTYGVDISEYAINTSPVRDRLKLVDVEEEPLPFPTGYFDLVTSLQTLEHLSNVEKAISEISRVLKTGGFFFMTAPSPDAGECQEHISLLSRDEWVRILRKHVLKPVSIPKFQLFKLVVKMSVFSWVAHSSIFGPVARKYRLHKMGPFGKFVKFVYDILNGLRGLVLPRGVVILARKNAEFASPKIYGLL